MPYALCSMLYALCYYYLMTSAPKHFLLHVLFLLAAVILAFAWTSSPTLNYYTLQLTAVFLGLFFVNQIIARKFSLRERSSFRSQGDRSEAIAKGGLPRSENKSDDDLSLNHTHRESPFGHSRCALRITSIPARTFDTIILTLVVLLLVGSTGGLTSPLFFLLYFLLFGLSLLFEPALPVFLALGLAVFFLLTPTSETAAEEILQLFSLFLVTPLAVFFGKQYLKVLEFQETIRILKHEESRLEREITTEETDTLLWLSLNFRRTLTAIADSASNLLADFAHLNHRQQETLEILRLRALGLLKEGEKLKNKIDENTD